MIVLSKRVRMYLFMMQMLQVPLIVLSRWSKLSKVPVLGNAIFWWGMYLVSWDSDVLSGLYHADLTMFRAHLSWQ